MNKYMFKNLDMGSTEHYSYFREYEFYEFEARNDKSAFHKAEKWQRKCEKEIIKDGEDLGDDPCLQGSIYRYNEKTNDYDDYVTYFE